MPLERAEAVATRALFHVGRCVQEADAVDAASPRVRNVDRRLIGSPRIARSRVDSVDEAKIRTGPHVVQLVERVVVSLVISDEQFARAVERQTHGKPMPAA